MREEKYTRRDFLNIGVGAVIAGTVLSVLGAVVKYLKPPKGKTQSLGFLEVATVDEIPVGGEKDIIYNGKPAAVTRPKEDLFLAMYRICTHAGCTVPWDSEREVFQCPCHDGRFDIYGKNIYGPPPKPLDMLKIRIEENKIFVGG